jgi:Cyclic nucleotide-binding domain
MEDIVPRTSTICAPKIQDPSPQSTMVDDEAPPPPQMIPPINGKHYKTHFKTLQDQDLIRLALHKSPYFSCLDEEQIDRWVQTAVLRRYNAGDIVILQGCVDEDVTVYPSHMTVAAAQSDGTNDGTAVVVPNQSIPNGTPFTVPEDIDLAEPDDVLDIDSGRQTSTASCQDALLGKQESLPPPPPVSDPVGVASSNPDVSSLPHDGTETNDANLQSAHIPDDAAHGITNTNNDESVSVTNAEQPSGATAPTLTETMFGARTSLSAETPTVSMVETDVTSANHPPPPRSGTPRAIYIVRNGSAGVWYEPRFNPNSLGPGAMFGEGGFLFGRQHSASVVASEPLECWVIDSPTFREHVLQSENMLQIFEKYATHRDDEGSAYMTMDEWMNSPKPCICSRLKTVVSQSCPIP